MTIHIEDLKFQCIIGILDFERVTLQDVIITLVLDYDYKKDKFINYVEVVDLIKNEMILNEYFLIEDALNNLTTKLVNNFSSIQKINLKITKPSILRDAKVSVSTIFTLQS
ncbi:MAG: dihydroneopterin aldolase [Campylobacterales bacterium]|nr:dihydroneopterin aldolase [Campylobacterales bacterium]